MRVSVIFLVCFGLVSGCSSDKAIENIRHRLLVETDYQALLTASRVVMRTRDEYKRDSRWKEYGQAAGTEVSFIMPSDPRLPAPIRALHADTIICQDDRMDIGFQVAGYYNMSFIAYAIGVTNQSRRLGNLRDQELTDGLWFYEQLRP